MTIVALKDAFLSKYGLACLVKGIPEVDLKNQGKLIAMMIYEAVNDIQSRHGAIENSTTISTVANDNSYLLPTDFGEPKLVTCNGITLKKATSNEINEGIINSASTGSPTHYAIVPTADPTVNNRFNINVYPSPSDIWSMVVYYKIDSRLFNPATDTDAYSTSTTILPAKYDMAIIQYLMDSMFYPEQKPNYNKEMLKLFNTQFSGENLNTYKPKGVI